MRQIDGLRLKKNLETTAKTTLGRRKATRTACKFFPKFFPAMRDETDPKSRFKFSQKFSPNCYTLASANIKRMYAVYFLDNSRIKKPPMYGDQS